MKCIDFENQPDFSVLDPNVPWEKTILDFWKEWKNEKDFIVVNTSGSTGKPKSIELKKQAVLESAKATCSFFNLQKGEISLLCLSAQYIAGKMMLVRSEYAQMKMYITEPKLKLEIDISIDFTAMTPSQCVQSIKSMPFIKTLILGGERVSENLKNALKQYPTEVYETYGMTESISHIAVKNIQKDTYFRTLSNIKVSQENNGTLSISAPRISDKMLYTNDLVEFDENGNFKVIGRIDNVINSGGIKISPEPLEQKIKDQLGYNVLIFGIPDEDTGEQVSMLVEGKSIINNQDLENLGISKYEIPKQIFEIETFAYTPNGKIDRIETLKKLKK